MVGWRSPGASEAAVVGGRSRKRRPFGRLRVEAADAAAEWGVGDQEVGEGGVGVGGEGGGRVGGRGEEDDGEPERVLPEFDIAVEGRARPKGEDHGAPMRAHARLPHHSGREAMQGTRGARPKDVDLEGGGVVGVGVAVHGGAPRVEDGGGRGPAEDTAFQSQVEGGLEWEAGD